LVFSEFNYTQWESKAIFEQRFLEKLDDEEVEKQKTSIQKKQTLLNLSSLKH